MSKPFDTLEPIRSLLDQLVSSLADVFESMAEQKPQIEWKEASGPIATLRPDAAEPVLWWEQPLQFAPDMKIWVGAPQATWEFSGSLVLKAAGLDSVEPGEAKNTWFEVLGQSLSAVARSAGGMLGHEVTCETGSEAEPPDTTAEWGALTIVFPDHPLETVYVGFSQALIDLLCAPPPPQDAATGADSQQTDEPPVNFGERSRTLDLLLDVDLPVSISFGKTKLPLKDVIKLTTGSIVELNRGVNEPVEVLVNNTLVARGEVVVVDGNYGVRILEIASRADRVRSLQ